MAAINAESFYVFYMRSSSAFSSPEPLGLIYNRPGRAVGTRMDQVKLRVQERAKRECAWNHPTREKATRLSEEKWGTTRSLRSSKASQAHDRPSKNKARGRGGARGALSLPPFGKNRFFDTTIRNNRVELISKISVVKDENYCQKWGDRSTFYMLFVQLFLCCKL